MRNYRKRLQKNMFLKGGIYGVKCIFHATHSDFRKRREKKTPIRERRTVGKKTAEEMAREASDTLSQKQSTGRAQQKSRLFLGDGFFCNDLFIMPQNLGKVKKRKFLLGPLSSPLPHQS